MFNILFLNVMFNARILFVCVYYYLTRFLPRIFSLLLFN